MKKQIIFSRFDSDYVLHKGLEFITLLLISPVLFLFPSSHLISILFLTFESSSNHSPLSIFWRASLSTALMQFLLGFMLLLQRNLQVQPNCFQPSKHEAHSFGCSLKVLYQQFPIFVNFSAKKTPSLSCSIIKKFITAVWKPALFFASVLNTTGWMLSISGHRAALCLIPSSLVENIFSLLLTKWSCSSDSELLKNCFNKIAHLSDEGKYGFSAS